MWRLILALTLTLALALTLIRTLDRCGGGLRGEYEGLRLSEG